MNKTPDAVIKYLQEELRTARTELMLTEQQIAAFDTRRQGMLLKVEAMRKALLEAGGVDPAAQQTLLPESPVDVVPRTGALTLTAAAQEVNDRMSALVANVTPPRSGIREAIRDVLTRAPRPMRAREVANELRKRGFLFSGKTDDITRTNTELWRMAQTGAIIKSDMGYGLAKEEYTALVKKQKGGDAS